MHASGDRNIKRISFFGSDGRICIGVSVAPQHKQSEEHWLQVHPLLTPCMSSIAPLPIATPTKLISTSLMKSAPLRHKKQK